MTKKLDEFGDPLICVQPPLFEHCRAGRRAKNTTKFYVTLNGYETDWGLTLNETKVLYLLVRQPSATSFLIDGKLVPLTPDQRAELEAELKVALDDYELDVKTMKDWIKYTQAY